MKDRTHLKKEIRAAQEEKIRKERLEESPGRGGLTPPRKPEFRRLRTLSVKELTAHIKRLQKDLTHLETGSETWANEAGGNPQDHQD